MFLSKAIGKTFLFVKKEITIFFLECRAFVVYGEVKLGERWSSFPPIDRSCEISFQMNLKISFEDGKEKAMPFIQYAIKIW